MTNDSTGPDLRPTVGEPSAGRLAATKEELKSSEWTDVRMNVLLCQLHESHNHWTEQITAMIEDDYRQLRKDFGLC